MSKNLDNLAKRFERVTEETREKCGNKLDEINQLIVNVMTPFIDVYFEYLLKSALSEKQHPTNSLTQARLVELGRLSDHILFLSCNGLYRNAFDSIRYILESIVQAIYIDYRHPTADIRTRIEIVKEVEDKREYHAVRLIDELEIGHKGYLRKEYKKLSRIIHPSHEQIITARDDSLDLRKTVVDCEEISRIYDSMTKMYDITFFLFLTCFPEIKEPLKKNVDFVKSIRGYDLTLLSRALKIKI